MISLSDDGKSSSIAGIIVYSAMNMVNRMRNRTIAGPYTHDKVRLVISCCEFLLGGNVMPKPTYAIASKRRHSTHPGRQREVSRAQNELTAQNPPIVELLHGVSTHSWGLENPHQVGEGVFPDTELELMHQVRSEELVYIKAVVGEESGESTLLNVSAR